jgi:hypothetical protein
MFQFWLSLYILEIFILMFLNNLYTFIRACTILTTLNMQIKCVPINSLSLTPYSLAFYEPFQYLKGYLSIAQRLNTWTTLHFKLTYCK